MAALKLKELRNGVAYPLESSQSYGKCLIHMKLTDDCTKSIDGLVNSKRGAVFSLRFTESGGSMVVPLDNGEPRKFQFKAAPIRSDGQNPLECVHQLSSEAHSQKLSCIGAMEHRLTVQGNDHIFISTKEKMKEVEQKRKEGMTQEITLPTRGGSRSKMTKTATLQKPAGAVERTTPSPTFRKQAKATPPKPSTASSANKSGAGGARVSSHTKPTAPVRVSHSLRERVVHILALKPQKRDEILDRLKKELKKNDPNLSAMMDNVLSEVSEVSSGNHKLRPEYHSELAVEEWPHYSDAERALMRRRYGKPNTAPASHTPPPVVKRERVAPEPEGETVTKKVKLHPLTSSYKPSAVKDPPKPLPEQTELPIKTEESHPTKKPKVKKKKKVKESKKEKDPSGLLAHIESTHAAPPNPTSTTTDIPDLKMSYPPIENDQQKAHYKQIFTTDYAEYLQLRDNIDAATGPHQQKYLALHEKLHSLPKRSEEASAVRKEIRALYLEKQQNKPLIENERRFKELHDKLGHIKKHVVDYDKSKIH